MTELTGSIDKIDTSHTHDRSNDMIQFTQVRSTKKTLHNNNTTAGKRSINVLPYFRFYLFENILSFFKYFVKNMKPHLFAQRSGQQISLPNFRLAYLNFRNAYVIFKSPRHFWDQVGIPENHERTNPYKLIPYDLGCILKFVIMETHPSHDPGHLACA